MFHVERDRSLQRSPNQRTPDLRPQIHRSVGDLLQPAQIGLWAHGWPLPPICDAHRLEIKAVEHALRELSLLTDARRWSSADARQERERIDRLRRSPTREVRETGERLLARAAEVEARRPRSRDERLAADAAHQSHMERLQEVLRAGLARRVGERLTIREVGVWRALRLLKLDASDLDVCRAFGCCTVFARRRRDTRYCSDACRKRSTPDLPAGTRLGSLAEPSVPGIRHERHCECGAAFVTVDPSRRFCSRCAPPADRTRRSRARATVTETAPQRPDGQPGRAIAPVPARSPKP